MQGSPVTGDMMELCLALLSIQDQNSNNLYVLHLAYSHLTKQWAQRVLSKRNFWETQVADDKFEH